MPITSRTRPALVLVTAVTLASLGARCGEGAHEPVGFQTFTSPQSQPIVLSPAGDFVYVANTTSRTVDVISTALAAVVASVEVGLDPVALAVRPDGLALWVSNHVSDSVSVIDTDPASARHLEVAATVQELDADGATLFDEPVGIAFREDGKRAYVALSSRDRIAVVDTALCDTPCQPHQVVGHLPVRAQEPRAVAVRDGLLYVAAFESGNRTELSACADIAGSGGPGDQCTLGLTELVTFATNPNIPGEVKNIVVDPQVPDRDLFVFDTATGAEVDVVSGVGTLLYGLAVDGSGRVFVTQTDARNAVNGDEFLNLIDLDNQMFDNQIAVIDCGGGACSFDAATDVKDLEPPSPTPATALATPYGIAVSGDDATLVATAAGSSRVFTLDASTLQVLDVLDLGSGVSAGQQIPRGVALRSAPGGTAQTAYVLNTLENSVSVVDVSDPTQISVTTQIAVGNDPTAQAVRRGRIAFNNAFASDTGTFSCESCHPDGNTDQLLWRIGGPCFFGACTGDDEVRSTMPIRGLKHTLPLHWDGTLGDPVGGGNGAVGLNGAGGSDCVLGDADGDHDCFVDLVDGSLSGVMCDQAGGCATGPSGLPGPLTAQERDDMATFLASVAYPPARGRRVDDTLSTSAVDGFADFFMDQGGQGGGPSTCADSQAGCHELPLGAATNSATLNGFDAPTMRGMTDRFLQFSLGITNTEEFLAFANTGIDLSPLIVIPPMEPEIQWDPQQGFAEITTFGAAFALFDPVYNVRPLDIFQMFEEASTGFSGAAGRQLTLDDSTAGLASTDALLGALEAADARGVVNLRAVGIRAGGRRTFSFNEAGVWRSGSLALTHADLLAEAQAGTLRVTVTAALRQNVGLLPQPLLATDGTGSGTTGDPPLPVLSAGGPANPPPFRVSALDVHTAARILVDGQPDALGTLSCVDGTLGGFCVDGRVDLDLSTRPPAGTHLLQVQNPAGLLSNELPLCVGNAGDCL